MANDREIERKYLLRMVPAIPPGTPSVEMDQGYLPGEKIRERIRRTRSEQSGAVHYYRTAKMGSGIERLEFEEETTERFFTTVWPLTEGRRVRKRRYRVETAAGVWEIDEFLDRHLVLAEIELERVDQIIDMPDFVSAVLDREVTDDAAFTNYSLAS